VTRVWLLTWTTYGTWLPGDPRGFVTPIRDDAGKQVIHNEYGTPCDADVAPLRNYAQSILRQAPVWLTAEQANVVAVQLRETAAHRAWGLLALAVMANHVHVVLEAPENIPSQKILGDLKAYATRALDRAFGTTPKRIWWTERGSKRLKPTPEAAAAAVRYVRDQKNPLVVWTRSGGA
jgi:REP element-mobilizing transposase RayT